MRKRLFKGHIGRQCTIRIVGLLCKRPIFLKCVQANAINITGFTGEPEVHASLMPESGVVNGEDFVDREIQPEVDPGGRKEKGEADARPEG
jgi:hypothetical protein